MLSRRLIEFVVVVVVFFLVDMIWIGGYAGGQYKAFYRGLTGREMAVMPVPAVVCYLILGLALWLLLPMVAGKTYLDVFKMGALAGFIIYGVYDMTTMAIFGRPYVRMGLLDWAWGTVAMGIALVISVALLKRLK